MRNYLQKFPIKPFLFALSITILTIVVVSIGTNFFLLKSKSRIERQVSEPISQRISIGSIRYLPLNCIILKNVSIIEDNPLGEDQLISIEKIKLAFSLGKLISKRDFIITSIRFSKPRADYSACVHFLKENIEQIIALIISLSREECINLALKGGVLSLPRKDNLTNFIIIDSSFKIKNGLITSVGCVGVESFSSRDIASVSIKSEAEALSYKLRAIFTKEALTVKNLEFKWADFRAKLWGKLENSYLKLYGFSSLKSPLEDYRQQNFAFNIIERARNRLDKRRTYNRIIRALPTSVYIFDIDCSIKFAFPRIQIDNVSFSLNNMPFRLRADVHLCEPPLINLTASTQKIKTTFKDLSFYFTEEEHFWISFGEAALSYAVGNDFSRVFFKDFNALFDLSDKNFKFVKIDSTIYDGLLKGEGHLDISRVPLRCVLNLELKDVSADKLDSLLIYFPDVYGKSKGHIQYRGYPDSNLTGAIFIEEGYLEDVEFFGWLAGFLGIPSLKKVNFDKLSISFLVNDKVAMLDKISLESEDVSLNGYFSLYENDLVASRLSLALSRSLLVTSPKLKSLLALLEEDFSSLNFDFQLSGLMQAMNFKWLESDFKRKLRDSIPEFVQKGMEEKVEAVIESISE